MSTSAMYVAQTGLTSQQYRLQVIANNLSNVNTTGFKRERANFETQLYQSLSQSSGADDGTEGQNSSFSVGTGVRIVNTQKLHTQGALISTENSLDLAIDGMGFFQVLMPDGRIGHTRAGTFSRSADGTLVTPNGYVVQPQIQIPDDSTSIIVSPSGEINVLRAGQTSAEAVGQLSLSNFINPVGLDPVGENLFVSTDASGEAIEGVPASGGFGKLQQGYLEASNVNVVQQLVDMIETQRAYEVSSKSIKAVDEMMQYVANNL
jgi:flagellar basal-body rod protein FlgG